jgi:putative DNA primase/helicase
MLDPVTQFRDRLLSRGIIPPAEIIADGCLHRCDTEGKRGKGDGAYVLHLDGIPAGGYENWRDGLGWQNWRMENERALSPDEERAYRKSMHVARQMREAEHLHRQKEARERASRIYSDAVPCDTHSYLDRKGIQSHGIRSFGKTLVIPLQDNDEQIHSLQFIGQDGGKQFLTGGRIHGCYYLIGDPGEIVCIAEGFATAASIHEATGYPVAVAFNAGNLEPVAMALREKYPTVVITIAADDDRATAGNPGITKATAAAVASGALLSVPLFPSDRPKKATDFNDMATLCGADAVKRAIASAAAPASGTSQLAVENARADDSAASKQTASTVLEASPSVSPRMISLRRGDQIKPQAIVWLWKGWLPAGKLTILAGAAGTGKTTLALGLAAVITTCGTWPDGSSCNQHGNVLIWSSEDNPEDTLVPRLIASGAEMSRCFFIEGMTQDGESVAFDPARDLSELHREVERIGGISLLIIDPVVSVVAGDMHRANDVRRSLQSVVDFADAHNCAVVGITHFAKAGVDRAPQDRVIGSQAFGALARMVLTAAKKEDGSRHVLARAKSNIAPDDGGVEYGLELATIEGDIETTHVVWRGAIEGTAREILGQVEHDEMGDRDGENDLQQLLVDLLTENGGKMPAKQVKAEVTDAGFSWTAANRAKAKAGIQSAKDKGSTKGGWVWYLPDTAPRRNRKESEDTAQNKVDSSDSSADSSEIEVEL